MKRKLNLLINATIFTLSTMMASHAEPLKEANTLKVSCTVAGQVIHKSDLPANTTFEQRLQIKKAFPNAMCIFLATEEQPAATINNYGFGENDTNDNSLSAALAAITGGNIGDKYPEDISSMFTTKQNRFEVPTLNDEQAKKTVVLPSPNYVNLTLGVYKNVKMSDILAHWKIMQKSGNTLKKMTPTFDTIEDVTVLSIMQVPDLLANKVCTEASEKGQGCIAFF